MTATVKPDNADDKTIAWSTSDTKVATVTNGKVVAIASGKCDITVTATDGGKTTKCTVTVNEVVPEG